MTEPRLPSQQLIEFEQDRLVDFVQSAAIGLHWVAADGTILWANRADYEPLGYQAEEYIGHNITEFHADPPVIEDILRRLSGGERIEEYEARLRCKDGSVRVVRITSSVLFDDEKNFVHTRCFTRDVTAEKAAEDRLRILGEASEVLASSLDVEASLSSLASFCVARVADWCAVELVREDGSSQQLAVAHVDPGKVELARDLRRGFPQAQNAQRGLFHVLRTGELEHVPEMSQAELEHIASTPEHEQTIRSLGLSSYIIAPILLRGRVLGALTFGASESKRRFGRVDVEVARGIANRAAQAIENARLFEAARDAARRKDEFLAMLGHELRNPLAPIRTALEVMKLRGDTKSAQEQAVIGRQVRHMVRLVDDLLDVSRVTRGKVRLEKEPVEVAAVVATAIEMTSSLLEQREHDFSVDVPPKGLAVKADPARLAQVLANLLNNAAKYTKPRGEIRVRARRHGADVAIEVEDNGSGIAKEELPSIFDLFIRGPQAAVRAEEGLGIGLKLAQSLVEMHGGELSAHSDGLGKGSRFTVRLPVLALAVPAEDLASPAPAKSRVPTKARNILVVDDNEDAAAMLAEALRAAGYRVEVAPDGSIALALVDRFRPDVALLDISLPVMDGYELAGRLRKKLGTTPRLLAVTGNGSATDRQRSRDAGFERHFVKPVALESLLEAVSDTASVEGPG